jgi:hypothetical protein
MTWCLTTVGIPGDLYWTDIRPITEELFIEYARRHEMAYEIKLCHPEDLDWMAGTIAGALGTAAVYTSIPRRRQLLDEYEGIIYCDLDAVILDLDRDVRELVTDNVPVAMPDTLSGNVQVLKSCDFTKWMLDECWAERGAWYNKQWAEEGFFKELFGWDWDYAHGDPARFLSPTEYTHNLVACQHLSNHYTDPRVHQSWAMNPGGTHPFTARLAKVREYALRNR